ncbi:hypothetical protein FB566_2129 [Stackebrandtia endophytica]|uniref:Uncharacterized protein n=1 Tax=Stackebrandtia endophytica TaxID=1496996 RepID=A0A543AVI9_9ACTN|nr:hypothetical protein [Stackebrandtia endophytica]TQL76596.1 hypothetical protein FB566_2129 [Stackebrandtia endophytica]
MPEHDSDPGPALGGFTDVKVNGVRNDVVVYQSGLLLLTDHSHSDPKRLRKLLETTPFQALVQQNRFIDFSDVTHAKIVRPGARFTVAIDVRGGEQLEIAERWTSTSLGKDDGAMFQDLLGNLRNTGPMPEAAAAEAARTWAEDAEVLDGMSNVIVNGVEYDLLVLDIGFVLVPDPGGFENGKARMTKLVQTTPLFEIVGRNWLIRYEKVVDATISKPVPVTGELEMYDGLRLGIKEGRFVQGLTDDTRDVLYAAFRSVGATMPY